MEFGRRLEVSARTVHRDMEALSASGVPVFALRGAQGGWQLDENWRTQVPGLDESTARDSPFGKRVLEAADRQLLGWAVRGDIREIGGRLSLPVAEGSRRTADGRTLRWRFAGLEQSAAEPFLPFFIEWEAGTPLPGEGGTARLERLELQGDAERLAAWLGEHQLPIVVTPGPPAVTGFQLGR